MHLAKTNIEVCQPGLIKLLTRLKIAKLNLQVFYIVAYYNQLKNATSLLGVMNTFFPPSISFLLGLLQLILFLFYLFFLFRGDITFYRSTVNPRLNKGVCYVM